MQSQKRPSGMFDRYLQDDSSSGHYERYGSEDADDDLTDEAEPMPAKDDEAEPKPGMMHAKHMVMVGEMMHLLQEMLGMFSEMLKSAPKKHKKPADESEDE